MRRGTAVAGAAALMLVLGVTGPGASAQPVAGPHLAGEWTAPFEEGGAAVPRCASDGDGGYVCKPTAVSSMVLPDGRLLYFNGIEAYENNDGPAAFQHGNRSSDSRARLLDLRSGTPRFAVPSPDQGGATNPNLRSGHASADDPLGMAGVPGRPGDGPFGSTWGRLGLPPHDPTSTPDDPAANDGDLFCADITLLADGRVLAVGGTDFYNEPAVLDRKKGDPADVGLIELEGLRSVRLFDPGSDSFTPGAPMKYGRWYPTLVALPDGTVLTAGGTTKVIKNTQGGHVRRTETYDPATDRWAENHVGDASENTLPQAARLNLMPDGKVYYAGVGHMNSVQFGFAVDEALFAFVQRYDPAARTWEVLGPAPLGARANAFQVMLPLTPPYDSAELLVFGGNAGPNPSAQVAVPFSTISRIDRGGTVEHRMAGNLRHARWYASGVVLPDGTVAAVGGSDLDAVTAPGIDKTVQITEVFDPRTGHWTEMAPNVRERSYHSSAVLMPDMRLLFGGHSPIGTLYGPQRDSDVPTRSNDDKDPSFEIWSPPYLFRGPRPRIEHAPAGLAWGRPFEIATPQAGGVESVVLLRLPSAQHVHDSDQRSVVLGFSVVDGHRLRVAAPPDGVVAPPGFYYLVVNTSTPKGPVPSVARVVRVGSTADGAEAPQPFPDDAPAPVGGSATSPSDPSVPRERTGPRIT
jgi:hypothetical protein